MRLRVLLLTLVAAAGLHAEGAIGVMFMDEPSPGVLAHFGGVEAGAVVMETAEGGPAAKAGLRLGDVVVAIGGKPVRGFDDLRELLAKLEPGDKAEIVYRRHKEKADGHDEIAVSIDVVDREVFWKAELEKQRAAEAGDANAEKP